MFTNWILIVLHVINFQGVKTLRDKILKDQYMYVASLKFELELTGIRTRIMVKWHNVFEEKKIVVFQE